LGKKIKKLRIGHLSTAYHTNFIMMADETFNNWMGVPIEWTMYSTGPQMIEDFIQQKLDIGYLGLPPAIIGMDKGVHIKCVAGGHVEGTVLIASSEYQEMAKCHCSVEEAFQQFKGKTIGTTKRGSIHEVILSHYVHKFGLQDEITIKTYDMAEFIGIDIRNKKIAAGVATPALAVFADYIGDSHIIVPSQFLWKNNPSYGILFHQDIIDNHFDIGYRFIQAHNYSTHILNARREIAAKRIADVFKIVDADYIRLILDISPKYNIDLTVEYVQTTLDFADRLKDYAYIKGQMSIDSIFEYKFVNKLFPKYA
jgi:ABC-type nitrate/sulfonate/bicarbonate transport system substrate-binding protein